MTRLGFVDRVSRILQRRHEPVTVQIIDNVEPEPSIDSVQWGAQLMRAFRPDTIIALDGGSPMDAAKVMWLLYEHPDVDFGNMRQKFSDIRKRAFRFPVLSARARLVCIPTSARPPTRGCPCSTTCRTSCAPPTTEVGRAYRTRTRVERPWYEELRCGSNDLTEPARGAHFTRVPRTGSRPRLDSKGTTYMPESPGRHHGDRPRDSIRASADDTQQ